MDQLIAKEIAHRRHAGQRDRIGDLLIDHVSRVAAAVPVSARPTAWLHDVLERTGISPGELEGSGLSPVERAALDLLTRAPGEPFEGYVLRIVHAPGPAGDLARIVKAADLHDHIERERAGRVAADAPPYRWALRHLVACGAPLPEVPVVFLPPVPGAAPAARARA